MPGVLTVSRWEVRKLVSQKRTYLGLAAAMGAPLLFVGALAVQNGAPNDAPFGASVRSSGLAIPLLMLVSDALLLSWLLVELRNAGLGAPDERIDVRGAVATRSDQFDDLVHAVSHVVAPCAGWYFTEIANSVVSRTAPSRSTWHCRRRTSPTRASS